MGQKELTENYPDIGKPEEHKDAPIRFTFDLDGRKEPVKIVEPEIDLPFPEGGRLLVDVDRLRWCDVVFRFDPTAEEPYRLVFHVSNGTPHKRSLLQTYGAGVARESDMQAVFRKKIVELGNVSAQIEMTHGKARLLIRYQK